VTNSVDGVNGGGIHGAGGTTLTITTAGGRCLASSDALSFLLIRRLITEVGGEGAAPHMYC